MDLLAGAVFIDFQKAFDTIDQCGKLLDKLMLFEIYDEHLHWMR